MTDVTQHSGPTTDLPALGEGVIPAGDPRYESMLRGQNHRFAGSPHYVRVVASTEQVIDALNQATSLGKRVVVRSGGHCFENFTASPDVEVLLDMSAMNNVYHDTERGAIAVEPGAVLGHVYEMLFKRWGVTIPAGECTEVGAGGHFAGGGYGPLSRRYGSVVDYLYGVEIVVVDDTGTARSIVATREPDDPHRDLWWAHTGGGGGNFGVVTRYWLRSPGVTSEDPGELLPKAPGMSRIQFLMWPWSSLTEESFTKIIRNFTTWFERNSAPDSPYVSLSGMVHAPGRTGSVLVGASIDDGVPDAKKLLASYFEEITRDVGVEPAFKPQWLRPWLYTATFPGFGDLGDYMTRRLKIKAAYLRKGYTDSQLSVLHQYLTTHDTDPAFILIGYGGNVNTVDPAATATAQRDSIIKVIFISVWGDEAEDEAKLTRIREFYRDVYGETGGVPVPNEVSDGSYINYPDADLADPAWNTSGVPWYTLYYKDNYPRLQQIKKRYDPGNMFRHALSIELPD